MKRSNMRSAVRLSLAAFAAVTLAACQSTETADTGTPVQPTAETAAGPAPETGGTIRWNETPGATAPGTVTPTPGTGTATTATTTPPPGAPRIPPGTVVPPPDAPASTASRDSGTIRWNTPQANPPASVPGAPVGPAVNWRSGFEGDQVWVEIIDPASFYRVDRVDLVAPDGRAFAARDVSRTQARYDYTAGSAGNVGVGMSSWGGSRHSGSAVGLGIGFPLGGGRGYEREDNATRSLARFQLADPESYRRTAANWSVRVRLVDRYGQASVARFPAPAPVRY